MKYNIIADSNSDRILIIG